MERQCTILYRTNIEFSSLDPKHNQMERNVRWHKLLQPSRHSLWKKHTHLYFDTSTVWHLTVIIDHGFRLEINLQTRMITMNWGCENGDLFSISSDGTSPPSHFWVNYLLELGTVLGSFIIHRYGISSEDGKHWGLLLW